MGNIPKSEFLAKKALGRDVTGVNKNREGRQMAKSLFIASTGRIPDKNEVRDFYKRETKGHTYSITSSFQATFGEASAGKIVNELEQEVKTGVQKIEPLSLDAFATALSTGNLTFHTHASYDDCFNINSTEPIIIYKVSFN